MKWIFSSPNPELVSEIQKQYRIPETMASILAERRLTSSKVINTFFDPDLQNLHDPFSMKNMDQAVKRIIHAIKKNEPIMVFGDYDVDGTTAASILYTGLLNMGAEVSTYIPNREKEGYGMSDLGIDTAKKRDANLIITCDCGTNDFDHVDYANASGIDVIITDHHTPGEILPNAVAILNPKQKDCLYPFKELCGGGVAIKLLSGLVETLNLSFNLVYDLFDLAALGTSADLVPMIDENRIIVFHGLKVLRKSDRPGLRELLKVAGVDINHTISVGQVVFNVAPRINAAGRLGDANRSVQLLTTTDKSLAKMIALDLDDENKRRQLIQSQVVEEAMLKVNAEVDLKRDHAIVLGSYNWHAGVVGIAASKLKESFHRPTIIIGFDPEGNGKGSARSVSKLNLYQALKETSTQLVNYGGHPMAAGLSLHSDNFESFRTDFLSYVETRLTQKDLEPTLYLDGEIKLEDIHTRFMTFLEKLSPFGPHNMRPKFGAFQLNVDGIPKIIGNGDHIRFKVKSGNKSFPVIGFNLAHKYQDLINEKPIDLAFVVEINRWRGQETIQLNARDIRSSVVA